MAVLGRSMHAGEVCRHDRFYPDPETGELLPKYLLFLAETLSGDWVTRLLTSRQNGRPRSPPCFHGDPYPGYFLGTPGEGLTLETWIDLRAMNDVDGDEAHVLIAKGVLHHVTDLASTLLCDVLECVAGAPDTTMRQERALRDQLSRLR